MNNLERINLIGEIGKIIKETNDAKTSEKLFSLVVDQYTEVMETLYNKELTINELALQSLLDLILKDITKAATDNLLKNK